MFKNTQSKLFLAKPEGLAKSFKRYGWIGFWLQIILAVVSIFLMVYVLFFSSTASNQQRGMGFSEYLALFWNS